MNVISSPQGQAPFQEDHSSHHEKVIRAMLLNEGIGRGRFERVTQLIDSTPPSCEIPASGEQVVVIRDYNNSLILSQLPPSLFDLQNKTIHYEPAGADSAGNPLWTVSVTKGGPDLSDVGPVLGFPITAIPGDDASNPLPLGFSFPFMGANYGGPAFVNVDGNITLGIPDPFPNDTLDLFNFAVRPFEQEFAPFFGNFGDPNKEGIPRIAPLYSDIDLKQGGSVHARSTPEALVVTWRDVRVVGRSAAATFQARLLPSGDIYFSYGDMSLEFPLNSAEGFVPDAIVGLAKGDLVESDLLYPAVPVDYSRLKGNPVAGAPAFTFAAGLLWEQFNSKPIPPGYDSIGISRTFYEQCRLGDKFDMLVMMSIGPSVSAPAIGTNFAVRHFTQGLSNPLLQSLVGPPSFFDDSGLFGSQGELESFINLSTPDIWEEFPQDFLWTAMHEVTHNAVYAWQWPFNQPIDPETGLPRKPFWSRGSDLYGGSFPELDCGFPLDFEFEDFMACNLHWSQFVSLPSEVSDDGDGLRHVSPMGYGTGHLIQCGESEETMALCQEWALKQNNELLCVGPEGEKKCCADYGFCIEPTLDEADCNDGLGGTDEPRAYYMNLLDRSKVANDRLSSLEQYMMGLREDFAPIFYLDEPRSPVRGTDFYFLYGKNDIFPWPFCATKVELGMENFLAFPDLIPSAGIPPAVAQLLGPKFPFDVPVPFLQTGPRNPILGDEVDRYGGSGQPYEHPNPDVKTMAFVLVVEEGVNSKANDVNDNVRRMDELRKIFVKHYEGPGTNGRGAGHIDTSLSPAIY